MCETCPNRSNGYCGCYDIDLIQTNGTFEPVHECTHPTEMD